MYLGSYCGEMSQGMLCKSKAQVPLLGERVLVHYLKGWCIPCSGSCQRVPQHTGRLRWGEHMGSSGNTFLTRLP